VISRYRNVEPCKNQKHPQQCEPKTHGCQDPAAKHVGEEKEKVEQNKGAQDGYVAGAVCLRAFLGFFFFACFFFLWVGKKKVGRGFKRRFEVGFDYETNV
jgi:hypothetical protein